MAILPAWAPNTSDSFLIFYFGKDCAHLQEGKASPKGRGSVGSSIHHANSLAEGVRSTLRRNAGSHPDLVHSGGSGVVQPEPAEPADKVRTVFNCFLTVHAAACTVRRNGVSAMHWCKHKAAAWVTSIIATNQQYLTSEHHCSPLSLWPPTCLQHILVE